MSKITNRTVKYRYEMHKAGEGETIWYVDLTPEEAAIVEKALDIRNWKVYKREPYSGDCWIDINNPMEIKELFVDHRNLRQELRMKGEI